MSKVKVLYVICSTFGYRDEMVNAWTHWIVTRKILIYYVSTDEAIVLIADDPVTLTVP